MPRASAARAVVPAPVPDYAVQPLGERVLVEQDLPKEMAGSLYIPDTAQLPEGRGVVLAIGPDVTHVQVGDRVLFAKYVGLKVKLAGDTPKEYELSKHVVVNEQDIWGRERA